jgi:tetratricopeptide (TPR) repeat protein
MAGCQALGGKNTKEIAQDTGMSLGYVYQQKEKVAEYAEKLNTAKPKAPCIEFDKKRKDRAILSLALDCRSSLEGIVNFFANVIGDVTVSMGYISNLLSEASNRARDFDDKIDLSEITQGANDEIFQCGTPILTGIDPESTYTYLLEEASDRTAETWALYLDDRKEHGINLETSINDGGTGLMAGIPQVFPDIEIQADTFHAVYDMGKELSKLERYANKLIKGEQAIKDNLASKRPRAKNVNELKELQPKVCDAINTYDTAFILYNWLKELLSFSGYSRADTLDLAEWVLGEMATLSVVGLQKEVAKVRKMLPSLLSFIGRLERGMEELAKRTSIPIDGFRLMYRQLSCHPGSQDNSEIQCKQIQILGSRYNEAKTAFDELLRKTKKASSLVENLNGRIRVFIEVKRVVPSNFLALLKVYFNTRKYKRSRCKERIGKSPLELLKGNSQPNFFEALGY